MFPLPLLPLRWWQTCCSPQMPYQCCHSQRSAGSHVIPSISGLRSDSRCFCGAGPVLLPQRSLPVLFRTGYHSSFAGSLPDWCFCQSWRNRDRSVQWSSDVLLCNSPHTSSVPPDYCRCPGHVNYSEYRRVQAASFLMYSLQNPFPFCFSTPTALRRRSYDPVSHDARSSIRIATRTSAARSIMRSLAASSSEAFCFSVSQPS